MGKHSCYFVLWLRCTKISCALWLHLPLPVFILSYMSCDCHCLSSCDLKLSLLFFKGYKILKTISEILFKLKISSFRHPCFTILSAFFPLKLLVFIQRRINMPRCPLRWTPTRSPCRCVGPATSGDPTRVRPADEEPSAQKASAQTRAGP